MLNLIKNINSKDLTYDFGITDTILIKIKEKVGDINSKIRKKAVGLYTFMMKKDFCDYNNLIKELIQDDKVLSNPSNLSLVGKPIKSPKLVLGKLDIFEYVLKDFESAIKENRTDIASFPFNKVLNYICVNLTHPKSEVRKSARNVVTVAKNQFGYKKIEPFLRKVDIKELEKIVETIPELKDYVKLENEKIKFQKNPDRGKNRSGSKGRAKSASSSDSGSSHGKIIHKCNYCKKQDAKFKSKDILDEHIIRDCVMYTNCIKCKMNVPIKNLTHHQLNQCSQKDEFKLCLKCKEAIDLIEFDNHTKEGKCNQAKGKTVGRCPLCHKDIVSGERGLLDHLTRETCRGQKRKYK